MKMTRMKLKMKMRWRMRMKKITCLLISLVCEAEVLKTCASSCNIHKKIVPKTKLNLDEKKETRKQYPFTPM